MQEIKKMYWVVPVKNALQVDVYKDGWDQFTWSSKNNCMKLKLEPFFHSAGSVPEQLGKENRGESRNLGMLGNFI